MKTISILIPCYNEERNIPTLREALTALFAEQHAYKWEAVFVDDGSHDSTLRLLQQAHTADSRFGYISLSRNFGKERALLAGIDNVRGDCMIIMDADLQHPIESIPEMISYWEQGFDDIYGRRKERGKERWLRRKLSITYYRLLQRLAKIDILPNVGDFRLLDRKCINALRQLRENERYTKGLYCWIGFRKKEILITQKDRGQGTSSYNYPKLFNLAIEGITSYTTAPLRISTVLGMVVSTVAFLYMCYVILKTLIVGEPVQGFPTLLIAILFLGGVQLISLGIIGEYLSRIFSETKNRPVYIIREKRMDE